jgi:hypothetical protein
MKNINYLILAAFALAGKFPASANILGETETSFDNIFSAMLEDGTLSS